MIIQVGNPYHTRLSSFQQPTGTFMVSWRSYGPPVGPVALV